MDNLNIGISKLLSNSKKKNNKYLTNKTCRLIKKLCNKEVNIIDHLFQGQHANNKLIGSYNNDDKEICMICEDFKKATFLSIKKSEKIINKWIYVDINLLPLYQRLILKGFQLYRSSTPIYNKNHELSKECYKYFKNNSFDCTIDICKEISVLENKFINNFKNYINNLSIFKDSFILIKDNSMSMHGKSHEISLLHTLLIVKVFKLKKIYFIDHLGIFEIDFEDKDYASSYYDLIKKIYKNCYGISDLKNKLSNINKYNFINKNILFLTSRLDINPPNYIDDLNNYKDLNNNLTILNYNQNKLNIPYYNPETKLTYVDGNKFKIFINVIKSLFNIPKEKKLLNSDINSIINNSIDEVNMESLGNIPKYSNKLSDTRINDLFIAYTKNIPPKLNNLSLD